MTRDRYKQISISNFLNIDAGIEYNIGDKIALTPNYTKYDEDLTGKRRFTISGFEVSDQTNPYIPRSENDGNVYEGVYCIFKETGTGSNHLSNIIHVDEYGKEFIDIDGLYKHEKDFITSEWIRTSEDRAKVYKENFSETFGLTNEEIYSIRSYESYKKNNTIQNFLDFIKAEKRIYKGELYNCNEFVNLYTKHEDKDLLMINKNKFEHLSKIIKRLDRIQLFYQLQKNKKLKLSKIF